jgi:hypothetical protein
MIEMDPREKGKDEVELCAFANIGSYDAVALSWHQASCQDFPGFQPEASKRPLQLRRAARRNSG